MPKLFFTIMISMIALLAGCALDREEHTGIEENIKQISDGDLGSEIPQDSNSIPMTELTPAIKHYTTEAKLIAVGDVMMHSPQTRAGHNPETNTYAFDSFFAEVQEIISTGNWSIANLETPLAGPETGYTGYPLFNAPEELADALKLAGFNIIATANNHSLDRREQGVLKTLEHLHQRELHTVGTYASQAEADQLLIVEQNEISMAILNYTYGTNGIPIPNGKEYLVNLIDEDKIIKDIQAAKEEKVDVITIMLHFGIEYQRKPNQEQERLVKRLIEEGADIILGSHPHVVQPYDVINVVDDGGNERQGIVIYSLGNFISNQREDYKDIGVIFELDIKKHFPEGNIEFGEIMTTPTWVHRYPANGKSNYRVLPMENMLENREDPLLNTQDYDYVDKYFAKIVSHIESLIKEVDQTN